MDGTAVLTDTYDAADQLVGWTYDNAGNLTNDGTAGYGYDATNNLTGTTATGHSCAYNWFGELHADNGWIARQRAVLLRRQGIRNSRHGAGPHTPNPLRSVGVDLEHVSQ